MKRWLQFLALGGLIIANVFGQELKQFEIQKRDKPSGVTATLLIDYPQMAAMTIWSSITTLRFSSNMDGIVADLSRPEEGKYILVLKPGIKQIVTVKSPGFIDGKIKIPKLKKKQFIYYEIESTVKQLNPDRGRFILRTNPPHAKYKFDGLPISGVTPIESDEFTTGTFKILLTKEKYEPAEVIISIVKGKVVQKTVPLVPKFGFIRIITDEGVSLYVDGKTKRFENNAPLEVPVGSHDIKLTKPYHDPFTKTIQIKPGETVTINQRLIRQEGYLTVETEPPGATVFLDYQELGKTPIIEKRVPAGRYSMRISLKDYRDEKRSLEILKGEKEQVSIQLAQDGIIHIVGTNGANVYINGKYKGTIPLENIKLNQGRYKILVTKKTYDPEERIITVRAETKTYTFKLVKTVGRPFRFTGFGNQRISKLLNGWALSLAYYKTVLTSSLMYEIANYPYERPQHTLAFEVNWFFAPIDIGISYEVSGEDNLALDGAENDSLFVNFINLHFSWAPFVFYETFYPLVGLFYNLGSFKYKIGKEKIGEADYNTLGLLLALRYQKNWGDGVYFIRVGRRLFFNQTGYTNHMIYRTGFWYVFGSKKKKAKTK